MIAPLPQPTAAVTTCRFASGEPNGGGILCYCANVTEATVKAEVDAGRVTTVAEVMEVTGAGTGCRGCHCRIQRVLSGLPARCSGRFDQCHQCGCINAICRCEAA